MASAVRCTCLSSDGYTSRQSTDSSGCVCQVLKFITCDRLFELHPTDHEGRLALRKDAVVSNVALAQLGQQIQLQQRLTTPFQCATVY